jgi:PTS system nitrogen regulatory IIA component
MTWSIVHSLEGNSLDVTDYMQKDFITLDLRSKKKESAIRELAQLMEGAPAMVDHKRFLEDVFEREGLGSTEIGDEIALPHARTDAVNQLIIAIGRSNRGVECETPDGKKVKLFFLMGTPQGSVSHYLQILAQLTRLLKRSALKEQLLEAQDRESFLTLFKHTPQGG